MDATWLLMGLAALIIGVAKTSFGGLGAVSVAMLAFVMPTKESTAAVLLLLITGDIVAVLRYRGNADWKLLKEPAALSGSRAAARGGLHLGGGRPAAAPVDRCPVARLGDLQLPGHPAPASVLG